MGYLSGIKHRFGRYCDGVHWLFVYIVWMVYAVLVMGILETAADRQEDELRGSGRALIIGAVIGLILSITILWFGPTDPFAPY